MLLDNLKQINNANPFIRYESIVYSCPNRIKYISDNVLLAMYVVDQVLKYETKINYSFYIKDDASIKWLMENSLSYEMSNDDFDQAIFIVDFSKLIYRFVCAKKFKVCNDHIHQLRINSWGNSYLKEKNLLSKYAVEYNKFYETFRLYFQNNCEIFDKITKALITEITNEKAETIENLNKELRVKLLS